MAESLPLPPKLRYVAKLGRGVFWTITDPECYEEIMEKSGVTSDEIDDLQSPAIQERGDLLVANAILLANDEPVEEFYKLHADRYDTRRRLLSEGRNPDIQRPALNEAVGEAILDFNKAMPKVAKQRKIFAEHGLKWNDQRRQAECAPKGGRSMDLITEAALALYREWHQPGHKVPRTLVVRISRALGWFFQPELLVPRSLGQRIANHL